MERAYKDEGADKILSQKSINIIRYQTLNLDQSEPLICFFLLSIAFNSARVPSHKLSS